jgi:VWFA-related protein
MNPVTRLVLVGIVCALPCLAAATSARQQTQTTFQSRINGVAVDVAVLAGQHPVRGLSAADFIVLDNGVKQQVTVDLLDASAIDVTLVLDTSGSVAGETLTALKTDITAVAATLKRDDRLQLLTVSTLVTDVFGVQPATASLPLDAIHAGGTTSFYNALCAALAIAPTSDRRRLIFAMSDGLDNTSFLDANDVRDIALRTDAMLYVALVRTQLPVETDWQPPSPPAWWLPFGGGPDTATLSEAADSTGGWVRTSATGRTLAAAFTQAIVEYRAGYVLRYTATGVDPIGWHDITVQTTNSAYAVHARKRYFGGVR